MNYAVNNQITLTCRGKLSCHLKPFATIAKMMETLPDASQNQVTKHRPVYIAGLRYR
ncbi:MAG: hypothetical protein Q8L68_01045 [Methylococcales bacterium]|nr:hypothetical protein [Methylococcales bacterium]